MKEALMHGGYNRLTRAAVLGLSSLAIVSCNTAEKPAERPDYCIEESGEIIGIPSYGTNIFGSASAYENDTAASNGSAKEYFLNEVLSFFRAGQLQEGTPLEVKVTAATETRQPDALQLLNSVTLDLSTRNLIVANSTLEVSDLPSSSLNINPHIYVGPFCGVNPVP